MNGKAFGAIAVAAAGLAFAAPASAEKMMMKINLTSAAEVPANNSPGKGTADVTYDSASKMLT